MAVKAISALIVSVSDTPVSAVAYAESEFPNSCLTKVEVTSAVCKGWFRQSGWNCKPLTQYPSGSHYEIV